MHSREIRQSFLDFFAERGHTLVPSSSLVPAQDPTLLFANAGMNQFKDTFLGLEQRPYTRAASTQRCLRVSGKHNDLEEVGPSPWHHTFFEMLGNFSFGDYFKADAIAFAWELLTQGYGLSPSRMYPSVFGGDADFAADDEAARLWTEIADLPPERIVRLGRKDNFWQMGDVGPAGPCSEIYYDLTGRCQEDPGSNCLPGCECGRWTEIWNLVFMQFELRLDGSVVPLPKPCVDTGMGFERLVSILQDVPSNYDTDLFTPILDHVQEMLGHSAQDRARLLAPYRAVADHSRAVVNMIADGILPGNLGRNSILRRILRRAIYQGRLLGFSGPFLQEPARVAIAILAPAYPHLAEKEDFVLEVIADEEERFGRTLEAGLARLETLLSDLDGQTIPGEVAFELYATYGYPMDLTRLIAREHGVAVDEAGFEQAVAQHQEVSRGEEDGAVAGGDISFYRDLGLPVTEFTGYETTSTDTQILALINAGEHVRRASEGEALEVVLARTPFYAEAGGQIGDIGVLAGPHGRFAVTDAVHPIPGLVIHLGQVAEGYVEEGDAVRAEVDAERRADIAANHTATHLLHRALRAVVGEHAQQSGSLVAPGYLRFDFTHLRAMTPDEIIEVERRVNAAIRRDLLVVPRVLARDEALQRGAIALFGEKYGDTVRMVSVEESEDAFHTRELCGGTHVCRTGEIGAFFIRSESSIGSGLRRIEAVTGRGAVQWGRWQAQRLAEIAVPLGVSPEQLEERVQRLLEENKERERQIVALQRQLAQDQVQSLLGQAEEVDGVRVIAARVDLPNVARLRELGDTLRDRLGSGVIVLATVSGERAQFLTMVTSDLNARGLQAARILRPSAEIVGGTGGGRPEMAQGGGPNVGRLPEALSKVKDTVEQELTVYVTQEADQEFRPNRSSEGKH
jgi:alanyl-tRNA synthetase